MSCLLFKPVVCVIQEAYISPDLSLWTSIIHSIKGIVIVRFSFFPIQLLIILSQAPCTYYQINSILKHKILTIFPTKLSFPFYTVPMFCMSVMFGL